LPSRRSEIATAESSDNRFDPVEANLWVEPRGAIECIIDADPIATCVREIMAERSSWTGSAADLLRAGADHSSSDGISTDRAGWPKNPRALAGRLRRAQTFLQALGIEITFSREGRAGSRIIRIRTLEDTVSTVSSTVSTVSSVCVIGDNRCRSASKQAAPTPPVTATINTGCWD